MKNRFLLTTIVLLCCAAAVAQSTGNLSFEVASVKLSAPQSMNMIRVGMQVDGGMLRYNNVSLRDIVRAAYRVKDFQIDGPDWLGSARFDVTAKLPEGATEEQVPEMLRSLLAERFKLVVHRDTKEHPIYALVVGKDGPKLKPADSQTAAALAMPVDGDGPKAGGVPGRVRTADADVARTGTPGGPISTNTNSSTAGPGGPRMGMRMMMDPSGMHLTAPSATLAQLTDALSRFTERPVVDTTGIKGQYDFDLVFAPETMRGLPRGPMPPAGGERPQGAESQPEQGPSIFEAVQQYGLKLEPRKGPLEMLTIDHIEKTPTEN